MSKLNLNLDSDFYGAVDTISVEAKRLEMQQARLAQALRVVGNCIRVENDKIVLDMKPQEVQTLKQGLQLLGYWEDR